MSLTTVMNVKVMETTTPQIKNGELVHNCETCPSNPFRDDWDD